MNVERAVLGESSRRATLLVALLVAGIWVLSHGYIGLFHDARLYALQLLARVDPANFGSDLFLDHGRRDQETLYSVVLAPLVERFGLLPVVRWVGALGALAWLGAAVLLSRRLLHEPWTRRLGILLLVLWPSQYGAWNIFGAGRHLTTPRVVSETLVLLALWLWTARCPRTGDDGPPPGRFAAAVGAVALLGLAAAVHPLMALPGCAIVALDWVLAGDRRRLAVGATGGLLAVAAAVAVLGADRLLERFDPTWWAIVTERSFHLVLESWRPADWSRCALLVVAGVAGALALDGWRRRLVGVTTVVAVAGVLANGLAVDVGRSVLGAQLQFFRFVWPLTVIAPLALAAVLAEGWRRHRRGVVPLFALVAALGLHGFAGGSSAAGQFVVAGVLALGSLTWMAGAWGTHRELPRWGAILAGVAALALMALAVWSEAQLAGGLAAGEGSNTAYVLGLLHEPLCTALGLAAVALLALPPSRPVVLAATALGVTALAVGLVFLDQREDFGIAAERGLDAERLRGLTEPGRPVYWQGEVLGPWLLMERPSYFSRGQGAGVVFSRERALEYRRRRELLGPLAELPGGATPFPARPARVESRVPPPPEAASTAVAAAVDPLLALCRDPVGVGAVVLRRPRPGLPSQRWPGEGREAATGLELSPFHVFTCDDILAGDPASAGARRSPDEGSEEGPRSEADG